MRIISGKYKGRKFYPPQNIPTRPTTDFAKEGLFNILENNWELDEVKFLDLFGGTGSITYEFASRGCKDITTVEAFPKCANFIQDMVKQLDREEDIKVCQADVWKFLSFDPFEYDLIFAGPPYRMPKLDDLPDKIIEEKKLKDEGWFILEHSPRHDFKEHPHFFHQRNYGNTFFSIFKK